jgi:putative flippase GtrA
VPAGKAREQRIRELFFELVRFGMVGLASLGIYFGLLWLFGALTELSLLIRATLAYGLGIVFNYLVQKSFTFRSQRQHQHAGPRYLVVQLGGMAINSVALWVGVDVAHWWYPPVQLAAIGLTAMWSYWGQKFWAFQGKTQQAGQVRSADDERTREAGN